MNVSFFINNDTFLARSGTVTFEATSGTLDIQSGGSAVDGLVCNDGGGTAMELKSLIDELKQRIAGRYGFGVEEEVQYVGDFSRDES